MVAHYGYELNSQYEPIDWAELDLEHGSNANEVADIPQDYIVWSREQVEQFFRKFRAADPTSSS